MGKGKLRVAFDLLFPYTMSDGGPIFNSGDAEDVAKIAGDEAVFRSGEGSYGITMKFVRPGIIKVSQQGSDADCGFGANVAAAGIYRKVSDARPKF